jgi:hypothetical protein
MLSHTGQDISSSSRYQSLVPVITTKSTSGSDGTSRINMTDNSAADGDMDKSRSLLTVAPIPAMGVKVPRRHRHTPPSIQPATLSDYYDWKGPEPEFLDHSFIAPLQRPKVHCTLICVRKPGVPQADPNQRPRGLDSAKPLGSSESNPTHQLPAAKGQRRRGRGNAMDRLSLRRSEQYSREKPSGQADGSHLFYRCNGHILARASHP